MIRLARLRPSVQLIPVFCFISLLFISAGSNVISKRYKPKLWKRRRQEREMKLGICKHGEWEERRRQDHWHINLNDALFSTPFSVPFHFQSHSRVRCRKMAIRPTQIPNTERSRHTFLNTASETDARFVKNWKILWNRFVYPSSSSAMTENRWGTSSLPGSQTRPRESAEKKIEARRWSRTPPDAYNHALILCGTSKPTITNYLRALYVTYFPSWILHCVSTETVCEVWWV